MESGHGTPAAGDLEHARSAEADRVEDEPGEVLGLVVALHRLVRSLRRASPTRALQPTQLIVLAQLTESGPLRIGALAERVPCSQPTATTTVASLESSGYVRREHDPNDGRAVRVVLTEAGSGAVRSLARGEAEALTRRLGILPEDSRDAVLALAPLLRQLTAAEEAD